MKDSAFLNKFEQGTLTRAQWTHEAHVRMAWLYVTRTGNYRHARSKIRTGIKRLNDAFLARAAAPCGRTERPEGEAEVKSTGYHETITTAFVRVIAARSRPGEGYKAFRDRNPDLFDRTLPALLAHYTPAVLFSEEARAKFVQPDLKPLPKPVAELV